MVERERDRRQVADLDGEGLRVNSTDPRLDGDAVTYFIRVGLLPVPWTPR